MANKSGVSYGLDKELEEKLAAKYSPELEAQVCRRLGTPGLLIGGTLIRPTRSLIAQLNYARTQALAWIKAMTDMEKAEDQTVQDFLKDGVALCKLINRLQPGAVKKVNESKMAFKQASATVPASWPPILHSTGRWDPA